MKALLPALLPLLLILPPPASQDPPKPDHAETCPVDCRTCRSAVERSLRYLSGNLKNLFEHPTVRFDERAGTPYNTTVAAIAGIAFLIAGGHGSDLEYVRERLSLYVRRANRTTVNQANWPLSFAALFYSELHLREELRSEASAMLKKIVPLLEKAQLENGGWGHHKEGVPKSKWKTYPRTLTSTTSLVAACLAIAKRRTGAKTRKDVFPRAMDFLKEAQLDDGGFCYDLTRKSIGSEAGRTIGALFALSCLQPLVPDDKDLPKMVERGRKYARDHGKDIPEGHGSSAYHTFMAACAFLLQGGEDWTAFHSSVRDRILEKQQKDGSFRCFCSGKESNCNEVRRAADARQTGLSPEARELFVKQARMLVTALYAIVLRLGEGRLKIFQKPEK